VSESRHAQVAADAAAYRRCLECGRGGALVERQHDGKVGSVCRWTERGLCEDGGSWAETDRPSRFAEWRPVRFQR
jgi:hypothetical protein